MNTVLEGFSVISPADHDTFWGNRTIQWLPRGDASFYVVSVANTNLALERSYAKVAATQLHWAYGDECLATYAPFPLSPAATYEISVMAYGYQALELGRSATVTVTTTE